MGKHAGHRRDRRRPARRGLGDRRRPVRPRVRGLHGRGGHPAPGPQRGPDAACSAPRWSRSTAGSRTLKDAINEAIRDWVTNVEHTNYLFGTAAGPHPFPSMVRDFARDHRRRGPGPGPRADRARCRTRWPRASAAARNAIGVFHAFIAGRGRAPRTASRPAAPASSTRPARRLDHRRQRSACCTARAPTSSRTSTARPCPATRSRPGSTTPASAPSTPGCTTPAAPSTEPVTDAEAMEAFRLLCRTEGIIPAIESAHAVAGALRLAPSAARGARARAGHPGQPVRPRRQGHAHRRAVLRHGGLTAVSTSSLTPHEVLAAAKAEDRAALIGYLPAGYPSVEGSIAALRAMVEGGVDIVEVGLPYSRPADGRPGHPARRAGRARRRGQHPRRAARGRRRGRDRRADPGHVLLEPDRALRRRRFAADAGRRRRSRAPSCPT